MAVPAVERIAHYRILKRIGRGGMGIVYRAVDERDGRTVALKVIREAEAAGAEDARVHLNEARVRFDREAGILKSLLHLNVVSFFEIGEEDGTPWLAMEYLDGVPLTSFAGRPYTETLPLLIQAAHGMEYLATRGIVHRDLSPDNILVIERGGERIVKLLDFGIAKLFERQAGLESLTATGFFLGKVAYGSPEQLGFLGPNAALDWRSDVYSLGVIFYQVLAGCRPFEGKAPVEYIGAHLNLAPAPVAAPAGVPPLPMELVRLIGQMLEKPREARPKSWREIVDRLVSVLRRAGAPQRGEAAGAELAPSSELPTTRTSLLSTGSGQRPATDGAAAVLTRVRVLVAVALAAVLLAAVAAVYVSRDRLAGMRLARLKGAPTTLAAARPGRPTAPVPLARGRLQVVATPFARVVSVIDVAGARTVPIGADPVTPCVFDLPPGTYRVVLSCPALADLRVEREVIVSPGGTTLLAEPFLTPGVLAARLRDELK